MSCYTFERGKDIEDTCKKPVFCKNQLVKKFEDEVNFLFETSQIASQKIKILFSFQ